MPEPMTCSCECDYDYEMPEFVCTTIVTARKAHKCCECGCPIPAGTRYERVSGKWCGDFDSFKTCLPCAAIRKDFGCSYGGVRNDLWCSQGIDYVSGDTTDDGDED